MGCNAGGAAVAPAKAARSSSRRDSNSESFCWLQPPSARRFDAIRAPQPVQWLADNGSAYTAAETTNFAGALNLVPCFTPVRSPESNGVCEASVKTLKRDYARVNARPDAISVLQQSPAWFEGYNT